MSEISVNMSKMNLNESRDNSTGMIREDQFFEKVSDESTEGRVLVLYTGGTIGMIRNQNGALVPIKNAFVKNIKKYPNMHDREYAEARFGAMGPLVLPLTGVTNKRVIYNVLEYPNLLDSSNMKMDDWIRIADSIKESYEHFDGFVVLHGTDTLSYTASALSFMLEALGKIVILTGSQLPIFDTRSDGLDNFLASLVIAANHNIPEVCVFFGSRLMRGNRTVKISTTSFDAFDSPNCPPLALAGINIQVDHRSIFRSCDLKRFHVHTSLNRNVGLLRLFPSITTDLVKTFLQPPIEGVVLQSYGAGNLPINREDLISVLKEATDRGIIIVNITQCTTGCVTDIYEAGKLLKTIGVVSGHDMTPEAALTKLAYVLSKKEWDLEKKNKMIQTNLRGELIPGNSSMIRDLDLVEAVARSLGLSSSIEIQDLGSIFFPAMLNSAILKQDIDKLESLKEYGANLSQTNADGRTALHIASCEGNIDIVRHLLSSGANVHIKDRFHNTPLTNAIEFDQHEVINVLVQCGAHLHGNAHLIGEKMCAAAALGNTQRILSFHLAGADLSQEDISGRTPLHFAALHNQLTTLTFLLDHGADTKHVDIMGHTAENLAQIVNAKESLDLLSPSKPHSTS